MATTIYISDELINEARKYNINLSKLTRDALEIELRKRKGIVISMASLDELKKLKEEQEAKTQQATAQYNDLLGQIKHLELTKNDWELDKAKLLSIKACCVNNDFTLAKDFAREVCGKYGLSPKEFLDKCTGETS